MHKALLPNLEISSEGLRCGGFPGADTLSFGLNVIPLVLLG